MVRAVAVSLGISLAGCQVVFPLDEPQPAVDGTLTRQFVVNNEQFLPDIATVPYTPAELEMSAELDDGRTVDVDFDFATGAFSFPRGSEDQRYQLVARIGGHVVEYASAAPHLTLTANGFGRPDVVPPAAGTRINGIISNVDWADTLNTLVAYATGTWTAVDLPVNRFSPFDYDGEWLGPLVEPAKHDRLYFLAYSQEGAVALLNRIVAVDNGIVDGSNTIDGFAGSAAPMGCVHLNVQRGAERMRITSSYPQQFPFERTGWAIQGLPASQVGTGGAIGLEVSQEDALEDFELGYNQPFPGFQSFAVMGVSRGRLLANGLDLRVGVARFVPVPMDCPMPGSSPNVLLASGTVPIASGIRIDDLPIDQDDLPFSIGTEPHELTWEIDTSAPDLYTVSLSDVTENPRTPVHTWITTEQRIVIDPSVFVAGRTYLVEIAAQIGFPEIATGNFATMSYPFSQSAGQSMTFTAN